MNRSGNLGRLACSLALGALAVGCQMPETPVPSVRKPSVRIDPCAERLHDVCGQLLLHYSLNKKLPGTLNELKPMGPEAPPPLVCPVSAEPYVYNPDGLRIPGRPGRLVLYDAVPCHSGMRWGILVGDPEGGTTLTLRVVMLPEESVLSAGKQP